MPEEHILAARDLLSAQLEPRAGSLPVRASRWVHYVVAELLGNLIPQPSLTDLVVRRVADSSVLFRLPAGDLPAGEQLLQYVQGQLETLTVDEFVARWGESSPAAAGPPPGC